MKHGVALPEDIWQCVASFIAHTHLVTLISVNRAFYNIVLDAKYREIHWDKLDGRMTKSLVRLRTPSIARRVRRLHVRAWFIEYLVKKESLTPLSPVVTSKRWVSRHLRLLPRVAPSTGGKSSPARDILESMTQAVRLMTQVTEYSFEWRDLSPTADTMGFLSAARAAFGVSLRKLTLHAQLGNFNTLLSTVDFDNLEELELSFDHDHTISPQSADLLRDEIAPFVNHFRRSIGSLLISSASKADLSPLFHAFQEFPYLHKLVVRVAFDTAHLADPGGLVEILRTNSASLTSVELGWSFAAIPDEAHQPPSTWGAFSAALTSVPSVFVNLLSLKMPSLLTFDGTMTCLRPSSDTLTSLCLIDHFLREQELLELVQLFAHRPFDTGLQTLYICLANFGVETLDLLANRLPGLRNLNLVLTTTTVQEIVHRDYGATLLCIALADHFYNDWGLYNLGIWEKRFNDTGFSTKDEVLLMEHLARCIPSLQTFKGEPINYVNRPCRVS
ncbi:hypothetical protein DFH06DRAFT_1185119 [Mycena polygramma]|nr:hypothetical protein DFH06DRAFT_1185119 [Mycena polygramma]